MSRGELVENVRERVERLRHLPLIAEELDLAERLLAVVATTGELELADEYSAAVIAITAAERVVAVAEVLVCAAIQTTEHMAMTLDLDEVLADLAPRIRALRPSMFSADAVCLLALAREHLHDPCGAFDGEDLAAAAAAAALYVTDFCETVARTRELVTA